MIVFCGQSSVGANINNMFTSLPSGIKPPITDVYVAGSNGYVLQIKSTGQGTLYSSNLSNYVQGMYFGTVIYATN